MRKSEKENGPGKKKEKRKERKIRGKKKMEMPSCGIQCGEPVRAHARIRTVRWDIIIDTVR